MRAFLTFIRVVALAALAVTTYDPDWVRETTTVDVLAGSYAELQNALFVVFASLLGIELFSVLIGWWTSGEMQSEARERIVKKYIPIEQWAQEIDKLNVRDAVTGKMHNPSFAVSRSAKLQRVTVVLADTAFEYYGQKSFGMLGVTQLESYERLVKECKLALMHEYIVAMRSSSPAREDSQAAIAAREKAQLEAELAGTAAPEPVTFVANPVSITPDAAITSDPTVTGALPPPVVATPNGSTAPRQIVLPKVAAK